jgi:hypothetical protein
MTNTLAHYDTIKSFIIKVPGCLLNQASFVSIYPGCKLVCFALIRSVSSFPEYVLPSNVIFGKYAFRLKMSFLSFSFSDYLKRIKNLGPML